MCLAVVRGNTGIVWEWYILLTTPRNVIPTFELTMVNWHENCYAWARARGVNEWGGMGTGYDARNRIGRAHVARGAYFVPWAV